MEIPVAIKFIADNRPEETRTRFDAACAMVSSGLNP